ncbi:type VI secretion system-associated FHA domain protein TagH [Tritonibacter horizontis]|uniref:FHA domain protein n=1 Tax=Tritonibacter horizontis TaxID=1768241 RepID=A0A132BT37_9RHOB|nr:type VI secretion system-associated FHA domain protein TagH [Tritonibacter horizontis]KUP91558.1 FHA domain protein [Tritonibacter horizontis]
MGVRLRFQSSGTMPSDAAPLELRGPSLTIGRGGTNDVVLPDPDQLLSRNHCVIEDHGSHVSVVDLSSNGTFLNYSKMPLGPTPTPLHDGDVLMVGSYELAVEITQEGGLPDPLAVDPLAADPLSPGRAENAPDPLDLLDDAGPGGDFLDDLLGDSAPKGPSQMNPVDPIDDLLPPLGEEEDPFFQAPDDGRQGQGASLPAHNPALQDGFSPQHTPQASVIPDDWDDEFFADIGGGAPVGHEPVVPGASAPASPDPLFPDPSPAELPPSPPSDMTHARPDPFAGATLPGEAPASDPFAELPPAADAAPAPRPSAVADPFAASIEGVEDRTVPVAPAAPAAPPPVAAPVAPAAPAAVPVQGGGSADQSQMKAFLDALDVEGLEIAAEDQAPVMARMGRVMRMFIIGLREILMTRTSIKSEFRIEQTMISAGGNNPLKFSISPEQAIESMIKPRARGYLDAEKAAEEALRDIKAHEIAMVTGMEAALKGVLAKLDPKLLESQIEKRGGLGGLLRNKKAQYWDIYENHYAEISDQAENEFHDLFSREFARAYKAQMDRLKEDADT